MIFPSAEWIKAFKLPTKIIAGLFVASCALLVLHNYGILDLAVFGEHAWSFVLAASIVFGSVTLTSLAALIAEPLFHKRRLGALRDRRGIRQEEIAARREAHEANVIIRIDYLSDDEIRYAADCLRKNQQSFLGYVYHGPISNLMAKGLVDTPGGTHNQDHYPFYFVDFAWRELLARKEKILARDEERRRREAESQRRGRL